MKLRTTNPFRPHLLTLAALLTASFAHAASPIWSGTTSNLWSLGGIGGNWTDADAPIAGDTLNFAGNTNVSTSNDLTADTSFAALNFTNTGAGAGAFTLAGNRITLGGNITTTATALGSGGPLTVTDTISLEMILSDNRTITTNAAGTGATGMTHNLTVSGIISETGGARTLTKAGTGTLTLSGPNTYTGTTAINVGNIAISNATALGTTAGNTTIAATGSSTGGMLLLNGGINPSENISVTGQSEAGSYQGAIFNNSGINTLSGNITLPTGANAIRITAGSGELVFGGTITRTSAANTLAFQAGSGAAITVNNAINNNNGGLNVLSYAGGAASNGVTLKGGTANNSNTNIMENGLLKLGVTNALKITASLQIGTTGVNTGFDVGTFDLAGFNQTIGALAGAKNSGGTIAPDSSRVVTNSAAATTSVLTVCNGVVSPAIATFNGVIQDGAGAVALTKLGTGTQNLVANSNYSGVTTISVGTLAISHANALGSTAGNTTIAALGNTNGGILNISGNINCPEDITITGATEQNFFVSAVLNTGGTNTLSGNITMPSLTGGVRMGATAGSLTYSGNISQTGSSQGTAFIVSSGASITVNNPIANNGAPLSIYGTLSTGTGTVTLKGVNGVGGIGATNVNQTGILKLGVTDALNTSANLNVGVTTTNAGFDFGTFDLAGFDQTVNALTGSANTANIGANDKRKITNSAGTGTSTLTVGNGNGTGVFNGVIQDGATAKIAIIKTGSGTQTLAGVNTYSGNTTVNGGTLTLNSANASNETSTVTIAAASAKLQLTFAATDSVEKLFIGATQQVIGEYGHTDSGATNGGAGVGTMDAYFAAGTGKLNVTTGPGGGSNFAAWQTANSTAQTIDQDHDNDSVPNGVEFFISGPVATSGFTPLPGVIDTAGTLSVTWTKAAGYTGVYGTDFVVETSPSLGTGTWANETASPNVGFTVTFPTPNEVKYTFPAGTKNFARLKVTGP